MPRDDGNSRHIRGQIAHLAARLMAVDGIDDYALAKRRAARQAGAAETRNLPTNQEVEQALRAYRQLYRPHEQEARLRHLRRQALLMMRMLDQFNPFLSGPVLLGSAGKYSDIDLHLFTDSAKDLELFLINHQIPYKTRERRLYVGDEQRSVPSYSVSTHEADFDITVFSTRDQRLTLRSTAEGRPFDRARAGSLEAMLGSSND
ncbi:MAG: UDP-N-acetylmuramate--alanine ligase [Burkholderiales bacterium]